MARGAANCCPEDENTRSCCGVCCCILTVITIILIALSFDVVKPTEFGLLQNGWTGVVYTDDPYGPGRHFVYLRNFFITFPATRVNVEFSASDQALASPVPARTGRDMNDPDSGGQPVTLSFSFQYQLRQEDIGRIYKEFGEQYQARYLLFARMAASDVAQMYTPTMFWTHRDMVANKLHAKLKADLRREGFCDVTGFQLLQVDFPDKYEKMITDIQLQVQYKLTSEYQQKVTSVIKDIDVLKAKTNAQIMDINAGGHATAVQLVNDAKSTGFYAQQSAKAESYELLRANLGLSNQEMLDYVKIRSLLGRKKKNTVIGTPQPVLIT